MAGRTFAEKIFKANAGTIVFARPDIILSHDNTASIMKIFQKMGGEKVSDPDQLLIVLDHNAPPTNSKLANDYQQIRNFIAEQNINRFHDAGDGICHQLMGNYAQPGMLVVGSDSHTCTAGAFNAFATGIDRTETAGLWKNEETWFKVPESIKISLHGKLKEGVYAKDIALYIMGRIGSKGADYMSVEYHGEGVNTLTLEDRMTIANLASEMGAKNAVFPEDKILNEYLGHKFCGIWADEDANYKKEIDIDLSDLFPLVACPHHVDNIKSVDEVAGIKVDQALIGTCTNGRIEDLRIAAEILKRKKIKSGLQFLVSPASREIYLQAIKEGLIEIFINAGANILSPSCGPCLGTGQGIPADGYNVISTANRNFLGRMGNKKSSIYLASPAIVAKSAITGEITSSLEGSKNKQFPYHINQTKTYEIAGKDNRRYKNVWAYNDIDNLNTDQMFAGSHTYEISSSEPEKILPYLFKGIDGNFALKVQKGDIIICGENFGCGSSREHPSVGLVHAGVKAIIVKSVSRIFFRSAINQGLPVIVLPEVVEEYKPGFTVQIDLSNSKICMENKEYKIHPLPEKLIQIIDAGGLIEWIKNNNIT